jgi:Ca2+-binding EF-hand superfamily protein
VIVRQRAANLEDHMRLLLTGAALGVLIAGAALAQDQGMMPPPPGGAGGPPPMGRMMQPLKRADVAAMVAQHFAMLDLNKDGVIDDADRVAMVAKHRADMEAAMKARRDRMFAALDTNKDGSISREEFDAPPPMGGRGPGGAEGRGPRGPGGPDGDGPDHMRGPGEDGPARNGPGGMGMRGHGGPGFGIMGDRLLEKADLNHDGKVTLAEAQKAALAAFDRADVNHDGTIDRDEMVVAMRDHGHWGDHGGRDDDRKHGGREGK